MSFTDSIFGDVIEWFLVRAGDRRQYARRTGIFHMWCRSTGGDERKAVAGLGIALSPNGVSFLLPERVGGPEYDIVVRVREQSVPLRVREIRADQVAHEGRMWYRYVAGFVSVAAEDWDSIVRYVNDRPEVDRRRMQNQQFTSRVDDAYRLLPPEMQEKIVTALVERRRLDEPEPGQSPMLKLFYGGLVRRPGKKPAHRVNVHSRARDNDALMAYDTRFLIGEDAELTVL